MRRLITRLALGALLGPAVAAAQMTTVLPEKGRETVLKQIDVPHNYYYREMYLPQLTSGPSSLSIDSPMRFATKISAPNRRMGIAD